jgi:hypothetical protein
LLLQSRYGRSWPSFRLPLFYESLIEVFWVTRESALASNNQAPEKHCDVEICLLDLTIVKFQEA